MQSQRQSEFCANLMYHESHPSLAGYPILRRLHDKMWLRLRGLPGLADRATRLDWSPHLSCKRDQIKMADYMDRRVTPPKRVNTSTWGSPPPCKQALETKKKISCHIGIWLAPEGIVVCVKWENCQSMKIRDRLYMQFKAVMGLITPLNAIIKDQILDVTSMGLHGEVAVRLRVVPIFPPREWAKRLSRVGWFSRALAFRSLYHTRRPRGSQSER